MKTSLSGVSAAVDKGRTQSWGAGRSDDSQNDPQYQQDPDQDKDDGGGSGGRSFDPVTRLKMPPGLTPAARHDIAWYEPQCEGDEARQDHKIVELPQNGYEIGDEIDWAYTRKPP
jgi:hypothetical protein